MINEHIGSEALQQQQHVKNSNNNTITVFRNLLDKKYVFSSNFCSPICFKNQDFPNRPIPPLLLLHLLYNILPFWIKVQVLQPAPKPLRNNVTASALATYSLCFTGTHTSLRTLSRRAYSICFVLDVATIFIKSLILPAEDLSWQQNPQSLPVLTMFTVF